MLLLAGAGAPGITTAADLTPAAQLGRLLFFDATLSASGRLSCASCHDPANAYAAPRAAGAVLPGGVRADRAGLRTVPSLRYLADTPRFARHTYRDTGSEREDLGPAGGFMLDGRADSLQQQALLPLLDVAEMANATIAGLARRLRRTRYFGEFARVFGVRADDSQSLADQAAAALERFELEDPSFHPYDSRFDRSLRGTETLSALEREGQRLFTDPAKGNCAACHTAMTGPQGRPPDFTDRSYHALGVPRNPAIPANHDSRFFDLGLCGPLRADLQAAQQYCGYFKTPTLRNVARRRFFFHNGRFTSLEQVVRFYATRDTDARQWYPVVAGRLRRFDDLPLPYRGNVNVSDAPLNRDAGDVPALDQREIAALVAFLRTLDDAT
jgi:cytochrome c peroxidase